MTVLLVERHLDFARGLADSVAIMDRGQIVFSGEAASLDDPDVRRHFML
jgi:urea transport system ATP-binding protein